MKVINIKKKYICYHFKVPYDFSFYDHCVSLSKKDSAFLARVNDAVFRILKVKQTLGILQHSPDIYPNFEDLGLIGTAESENVSLEAARESIVLAKNVNNILPLSKNSNILLVGPSADLLKVLNGGWSYKWQGSNETYFQTFSDRNYKTIYKAIQSKSNRVSYIQGANFESLTTVTESINAAINTDYIVLCIGEDTYTGNNFSFLYI